MGIKQEVEQMAVGLNKVSKDAHSTEPIGDIFLSDINDMLLFSSCVLGESTVERIKEVGFEIPEQLLTELDSDGFRHLYPTIIPKSLRHTMGIDRAMRFYKSEENDEPKAILSMSIINIYIKLFLSIEDKSSFEDINEELKDYVLNLFSNVEKLIKGSKEEKNTEPQIDNKEEKESQDFNELSLSEQVEILISNASSFNNESYRMAMLCIASKMGEMSENHVSVFWAYEKDKPTKRVFEQDGQRLFYLYVSEDSFLKIPEEKKALLDLEKVEMSVIIEECMMDKSISGIAIDPFVNSIGMFFANRDVVTLAW